MNSIGLDFGTTNTAMALGGRDGNVHPVAFAADGQMRQSIRTALCYWRGERSPAQVDFDVGPWAIDRYLEDPSECRFIQSFKTFAASASFSSTQIFSRRCTFADLMADYLERALHKAPLGSDFRRKTVVVGRPVQFAGVNAQAAVATERYREALRMVGFEQVVMVYEPVAAAMHFAQRLATTSVVLVADLGGGTTDFSIVEFRKQKGSTLQAVPISYGGVGVAGDSFDYRIIDNVILPRLGKGSTFASPTGTLLPVAAHYFHNFAQWNTLSLLKYTREFRDLRNLVTFASQPQQLRRFVDLIERNQGYALYRAVSAAKERLSSHETTTFSFAEFGWEDEVCIGRDEFDRWIAADLARIEAALNATLVRANLREADVDQVFVTGGTSFVPAVMQLFQRRFGPRRVASGDQLTSIASGMGLIAGSPNPEDWGAEGA